MTWYTDLSEMVPGWTTSSHEGIGTPGSDVQLNALPNQNVISTFITTPQDATAEYRIEILQWPNGSSLFADEYGNVQLYGIPAGQYPIRANVFRDGTLVSSNTQFMLDVNGPFTTPSVKVYNGSGYDTGVLMIWNGTGYVPARLRRWNGSIYVNVE